MKSQKCGNGLGFFYATVVVLMLVACSSGNDAPRQGAETPPAPPPPPVAGFSVGPFVDGSDPDLGATVDEATVASLMTTLADLQVEWLRTFGSTNGLEHFATLGHDMGFKIAMGAWIDANATTNETEVAAAIELAQAGLVDAVLVGSEALLRREIAEAELIALIERVRAEVPDDVAVTYADVYHEYLRRPALVSAVDAICANFYPFWQGIALDDAVGAIDAWYEALIDAAEGRPVWACESGWPTDGSPVGDAQPGLDNSVAYLTTFLSWAESRDVLYFYFEAFDEPWKSRLEGDVGDHWGVLDRFGNLKPGMEGPVIQGDRVANSWSGDRVVDGPGIATIEFTTVPPINTFDDLHGRVSHVNPTVHSVAVYIRVSGRWWTKPTFAQPLTIINPDGSWTTDITTGGIDQRATEIAAYLLPIGLEPPRAAGASGIPTDIDAISVASAAVVRQ